MSIERHGISVGIERVSGETIVVFKAKGKLTHDDYQAMIPILNATLEELDSSELKMLVDISTLTGWELRACLLYTSPSPRDGNVSRMPSSA